MADITKTFSAPAGNSTLWVELTTGVLAPVVAIAGAGGVPLRMFAEDSAHTSGDAGIQVLAVQKATPADMGTEGDYVPIQVSGGYLWARVGGTVAAGSADSGNPVKVGGIYKGTPATLTDGLRGDLTLGSRGAVKVQINQVDGTGGNGWIGTDADGQSNAFSGPTSASYPKTFNETTWDRRRGNTDITLLASAARTTTQSSADLVNYNADALKVVVDITAFTAGSLTITIDGKDTASGKYVNLLTSTALAAVATTTLQVGPVIAASANLIALAYMPRVFRIVATVGDATSITYSIGYHLVRAR